MSFFKSSVRLNFNSNTLVILNRPTQFYRRRFSTFMLPYSDQEQFDLNRQKILKKYDLTNLNLVWPQKSILSNNVDYIEKNPCSISQMYSDSDLSKLPIFGGGLINFGYWPNSFLENEEITIEQRIACSKEIYKIIANLAGILHKHNLLEVGCGLGYGASLISQYYQPKLVVGVDISPDQIARAKKYQVIGVKEGKLRFTISEAESMPFPDNSFDRIISVEAAQHFDSMNSFSKEVARILKPNGKFVMTSFFPKNKEGVEAVNAIIPDYYIHGSQYTIDEVKKEIFDHMHTVKVTSIGENVWHGFSKWLDQIGFNNQWSKIWPALYDKHLIDYVIYEAEAPRKLEILESDSYPSTCRV